LAQAILAQGLAGAMSGQMRPGRHNPPFQAMAAAL